MKVKLDWEDEIYISGLNCHVDPNQTFILIWSCYILKSIPKGKAQYIDYDIKEIVLKRES